LNLIEDLPRRLRRSISISRDLNEPIARRRASPHVPAVLEERRLAQVSGRETRGSRDRVAGSQRDG
jgi:hypothetical protein